MLLLLTVDSGVFMISINTATEAGIVYKFCSEGLRPAMHSFHNSKGVNGLRELKRPSQSVTVSLYFMQGNYLLTDVLGTYIISVFHFSTLSIAHEEILQNLPSFCAL